MGGSRVGPCQYFFVHSSFSEANVTVNFLVWQFFDIATKLNKVNLHMYVLHICGNKEYLKRGNIVVWTVTIEICLFGSVVEVLTGSRLDS